MAFIDTISKLFWNPLVRSPFILPRPKIWKNRRQPIEEEEEEEEKEEEEEEEKKKKNFFSFLSRNVF